MNCIFIPIEMDINYLPEMHHPMVKAYLGAGVEFSESHIECIYEAIQLAEEMVRNV